MTLEQLWNLDVRLVSWFRAEAEAVRNSNQLDTAIAVRAAMSEQEQWSSWYGAMTVSEEARHAAAWESLKQAGKG